MEFLKEIKKIKHCAKWTYVFQIVIIITAMLGALACYAMAFVESHNMVKKIAITTHVKISIFTWVVILIAMLCIDICYSLAFSLRSIKLYICWSKKTEFNDEVDEIRLYGILNIFFGLFMPVIANYKCNKIIVKIETRMIEERFKEKTNYYKNDYVNNNLEFDQNPKYHYSKKNDVYYKKPMYENYQNDKKEYRTRKIPESERYYDEYDEKEMGY